VVDLAKNALHRGGIVDQKVAGARAQEHFNGRYVALGGALELLEVGVGCAQTKAVVGPRNLGGAGELGLEQLQSGRGGNGVGLLYERRYPAGHGRHRFGAEVGLVGESGLAKMHLGIDDAGNQYFPPAFNDLDGVVFGRNVVVDALDASARKQNVRIQRCALR